MPGIRPNISPTSDLLNKIPFQKKRITCAPKKLQEVLTHDFIHAKKWIYVLIPFASTVQTKEATPKNKNKQPTIPAELIPLLFRSRSAFVSDLWRFFFGRRIPFRLRFLDDFRNRFYFLGFLLCFSIFGA